MGWLGWLLYQPYKWLMFAPVLLFSTLFFGCLTIILVFVLPSRWVSLICGTFWARLNSWLTPIRVEVAGRSCIQPRQSYVVVSNHQSFYDVFVLYGWLGVDFKWVLKKEMRQIPGLGVGCEKVGHIFIDRSNRKAAIASINAAKARLVEGSSVIFFPEGTRSRDGQLGGFKRGAFRVAVDLGLPILPVTLIGTGRILPSDGIDIFPGRVSLIIHPPVETGDLGEEDLSGLVGRVRDIVAAPLVAANRE